MYSSMKKIERFGPFLTKKIDLVSQNSAIFDNVYSTERKANFFQVYPWWPTKSSFVFQCNFCDQCSTVESRFKKDFGSGPNLS